MSRFFVGDSSSDEESNSNSDSSSESSSEEEVQEKKNADAGKMYFDSSESEEEKRVVRTEKDKRHDEMKDTIKQLNNAMKIKDWVKISTEFENLNKQLAKAKNITRKEGVPRFFMKACLSVDDMCEVNSGKKTDDSGKKLNASTAKALNSMRQKLRKWTKEFERQIEAYKKNPLADGDDDEEKPRKKRATKKKVDSSSEEESSEEEDEEKPKKKPAPKKAAPKKAASEDDEDGDEDEGDDEEFDDDDEFSDLSESDEDEVDLSSKDMFSRSFWVKKKEAVVENKKDLRAAKAAARASKAVEKETTKETEDGEEKKTEEKPKAEEKVYTPEAIMKKLKELLAKRGKRGTDRTQVVDDLLMLSKKATTPVVQLKVKTTLVSAYFDLTLNTMKFQPIAVWKDVVRTLMEMIGVLNDNPNVRLSEDEEVREAFEEEEEGFLTMESLLETDEEKAKKAEAEREKREEMEKNESLGVQYIHGNLYAFVQRCCAEFRRSLQCGDIDPHTPAYVERLKDEPMLLDLVTKTQDYYEKTGKMNFQRHACLLRLELVYYHYNAKEDVQTTTAAEKMKAEEEDDSDYSPPKLKEMLSKNDSLVAQLAIFLYQHGESYQKTQALLCHVYYLALHNRFTEARGLFLMSHVQDTINDADIHTRILFNRTTAQMGLCAFRVAHYRQALDSLTELYLSGRIKELLAQGISSQRFGERDLAKEKLERRRQYPYHMHMNLDVLESVHLLSAMFVEVPNTAENGQDNKRKIISKTFRRLLDHHQGKAFNGPPENTRECVMAATTDLQKGDWKQTLVNVKRLKMWSCMLSDSEIVQKNVEAKIREVALRTYLLSYASYYRSISLESLVARFELPKRQVHQMCSKMMNMDQLQGSWDVSSECLIMNASVASKLQRAALHYASKATLFMEQNERLMEQKFGYSASHHQRGNWNNNRDNNNNNNSNDNNNRNNNNDNNDNNNNRNNYHNRRPHYQTGPRE